MKPIPLITLLLCACLSPTSAQAKTLSASEGRVTCELSGALLPVPKEELENPQFLAAYRTESKKEVLTVTRSKNVQTMALKDLPEVKAAIEQSLTQSQPDAKWFARELVTVNNRQWIHFDFAGKVKETPLRISIYVTSYRGDKLQFLFQSGDVERGFPMGVFQECEKTLRVNEE